MSKGIIKLLQLSFKLDIYDLNYNISSEEANILSFDGLPRKGMLIRIMVFFRKMFKSFRDSDKTKMKEIVPDRPLFFAFSKNQHDAIFPIASKFGYCNYLGINKYGDFRFSLRSAYMMSFLYFPVILSKYFRAKDYHKRSFQYFFEYFWLTYGYYLQCCRTLNHFKPSMVVVSNDHLMYARAFVLAAKQANIKTVYLQHASILEKFPPLFFDFAFLDGYDSLNKYADRGKSGTKIFLTGFPKFDRAYEYYNKKPIVENVGICIGTLEEESEIKDLIMRLMSESDKFSFCIRPHPGDKRIQLWKDLATSCNFDYSDSREESSFQFLIKVDVIISGESNILLEAALMNVYPIYYEFSSVKIKDMYGFVKNNLVDKPLINSKDLILTLNRIATNRPFVRDRTKYYNAVINTEYDGNSLELVIQLLNAISSDRKSLDVWKRVTNPTGLEVYQLKS